MIVIEEARCSGCGICLTICPQDAIVLEAQRAEIKEELCTGCGVCLSACPEGAILDVEPALAAQRSPSTSGAETAAIVPSARSQPAPRRAHPVKVIWDEPSALDRRRVVAAATMAAGPLALDLVSRLAERWLRRGAIPRRPVEQRNLVAGGPRGGRRRRWRGGRPC